jgi:hypothetical protein
VLGYFELLEDEQPPQLIWGNDDALEKWFADVKLRRDNPHMEPIQDAPMTQNALTADLLGG